MRFLGVCVGTVLVAVAAAGGAGCHTGGTLTGAGGDGKLSGIAGRAAGGRGGGVAVVGTAGAGPITGAAGDPEYGCGVPMRAAPVPGRIVIVLDTSASMNDAGDGSCAGGCGSGSKWSAAVGGIDAVVGVDGGPPVQWGLKFIGGAGNTCDPGIIDIIPAPDSAHWLMTALAGRTTAAQLAITGNTPTRAAIGVATSYFFGLTTPGGVGILLVTDGQPDCATGAAGPTSTDTAATIQAITNARTAGIPTSVIGLGVLDPGTDDALSRMAQEGGLPRAGAPAYYPAADARDVVTAMNQIVATSGSCMFAIPPAPTPNGLTSQGNITVFADGNPIFQDANNGWTYSDSTQTSFTLHGTWCDAVNGGTFRQLSVVFNCLLP